MSNSQIEIGRALIKDNLYAVVCYDPENGNYILSLESKRVFKEICVAKSWQGGTILFRLWMELTGKDDCPWYGGMSWRDELRFKETR